MDWIDIIAVFVVVFAGLRLLVALVNLINHALLDSHAEYSGESVDMLIPARNEAANIGFLLHDIQKQTYTNLRVLIYDDNSEDNTCEVIRENSKTIPALKIIPGKTLPNGWSGKNYACHQLSQQAEGHILIFLDADVRISSDFTARVVSHFRRHHLRLLSFFPVQIIKSSGEKLVVPLINWILLTLLPLFLVRKSSKSALAAANGQCMIFDTENYRRHHWHEMVKNDPVEDIAICQQMKKHGYSTETLLGQNEIQCRMYKSFREAFDGVSRSAPAFFDNHYSLGVLFVIWITAAPLLLLATLNPVYISVYAGFVILTRILVALLSKQSLTDNVLLHPLQMCILPFVVLKGIYTRLTGAYHWKNRRIAYQKNNET